MNGQDTSNSRDELYWLFVGTSPIGPLSEAVVRARLASGEITRQTPACRLGGKTWVPVEELLGFDHGPANSPPANSPVETAITTATIRPDPKPLVASLPNEPERIERGPSPLPPRASRNRFGLKAVAWAFALTLVGWIGYSWIRPLSPREVSERFINAATVTEAKRYSTSNMHRATEAMFRVQTPGDPKDSFELTQEASAPPEFGGHLVGCRFQIFDPTERRMIQCDGLIHLIHADSWRVEDVFVLSVDRQPFDPPISLAADAGWLLANPEKNAPVAAKGPGPPAKPNPLNGPGGVILLQGVWKVVAGSGAGKWIGGILLALGALLSGVWSGMRERKGP